MIKKYIIIVFAIILFSSVYINSVYAASAKCTAKGDHYSCELSTRPNQTCIGVFGCGGSTQCCIDNKWQNSSGTGNGILPAETGGKGCPQGAEGNCGDYSLNDFISLAIKISDYILGIVGSLALLAFVYGGIVFLISGGSSEKVEKGKQILLGAVIGLAVVFASYTIIQFTMSALGVQEAADGGWAKTSWFTGK